MFWTKILKTTALSFLMLFPVFSRCFAVLNYQETYRSATGINKVLITVNSSIYTAIFSPYLTQYISDLEAEDYNVTLIKYTSGTAQELKDYIKLLSGLKGVIFVGDMPTPNFEIADDFNQYGYQSFPVDLFFMDLDGVWQDIDGNGIYDTHTAVGATLGPEIWLGRLTSSPIYNPTMDQVALLRNYFSKNHSYRIGTMSVVQRGLSYPDDDWYYFNDSNLSSIYGSDVTVVNDVNLTTAADYKSKLALDYEWVHVCAHSNSSLNSFYENDRASIGYVYNTDIRTIDPKAVFFNLFACSNAKYNDSNYMGGNYIFAKTKGLAAVGSTKIGSMLSFDYFYSPLGPVERKNLGEAFKSWFRSMYLEDFTNKCWFYGMTLLGDPTLSLDPPIATIDYINPATVGEGQPVELRGSGRIYNGSIAVYSWRSSIDGYLSGYSSFTATSLSRGIHKIYFKVQDNRGRWSSEAEKTITVGDPGDTIAPQVSILSPANNSRIKGKVTIRASATDNIAVTRLELFIDGALKSSVTTGSLTYVWNVTRSVKNGSHIITVKGYDAKGNIGTTSITVIK